MPNNVYPDLTNSKFDVKYARRKVLFSDVHIGTLSSEDTSVLGRITGGLDGGPEPGGNSIASPIIIDRFRVGPDQPMENAATTYTNALLAGKSFMILANGTAIHQIDDDPTERYASKDLADDTITINGGVTANEVIEIYIVTPLIKFRVAADQPMEPGATTYTNALLINCNFLMQANGTAIHQMTDDITERFSTKALSSDTITVNGGVNENEVIEIYLIP